MVLGSRREKAIRKNASGYLAGFGVNYPGGIGDVPCGGLVTGIGKIHIHQGIDGRKIINAIADDSYFVEYNKSYAPSRGDNTLTGKIRIKGIPVGCCGLPCGIARNR